MAEKANSVEPGGVQPVDVVLLTAAEGEDDAVRLVEEGRVGEWEKAPGPPNYGFDVWRAEYEAADGKRLSFVLSKAFEIGGDGAGNAAARLVDYYKPRCLAMCGVCAGDPSRVNLGDVIIADRVWRFDKGETENPTPGEKPVFRADTMTHQPPATWKARGETFQPTLTGVGEPAWLKTRPRPRELQAEWVLAELLAGRDPLKSAEREICCKDWTRVVKSLEDSGDIVLKSGRLRLAPAGRERIKNLLARNAGKLPEQAPWKIHVGPMGTGDKLEKDVDIWERIRAVQKGVLGLEMEASVVGFTGYVQKVDTIVVKGVMDHAVPNRKQGFREFAARAAAEVLIGLLRQVLEPGERANWGDMLRMDARPQWSGAQNPGSLLRAENEIVAFDEEPRRRELELLESWKGEAKGVSVRLFCGPGGAGKTRLFLEWTKRLRAEGWQAGFLRDGIDEGQLAPLLAVPGRACMVIDYAECRAGLHGLLRLVAERASTRTEPLLVVLLARETGDWWRSLCEQYAELGELLQRHLPVQLAPVAIEGDHRRRVFSRAADRFAEVRGKERPSREIDLVDERFGRVLYLHMAALAVVEGLPVGADELLGEIVVHEEHFWSRQFSELYGRELLGADQFRQSLRRTVAALTLLGGAATLEEARSVNERAEGPDDREICPFLHWLYPGHGDGDSLRLYLTGLEPDLLGETLVVSVLADLSTSAGYLLRVFDEAEERALVNGFTILGRIGDRGCAEAVGWIARLLDADVAARGLPAFQAALSLGEKTAFAPLGQVLAESLGREGTSDLAAAIEGQMPEQTVSLREVAVWATQRLLDNLPPGDISEEIVKKRARLLNNVGGRLSALGRREEALEAAGEAVEHCRRLVEVRPDAFLPDLAMSLGNLGTFLGDLGQREEALEAAREGVEIRRHLAETHPDAFLPDLAGSLSNLGTFLSDLGRREEALEAAREAVEHYRYLAEVHPDAFLPDLASSLNNLGPFLSDVGRRVEALEAAREAVEHYRHLAEVRPDAFLPYLAASLNNLGKSLSELGRRKETLRAAREAAEHYRRLAEVHPDAFLPNLAMSLNNLGISLSDLGRRDEALEAAREAVEHYRRLAELRPDAFLPDLAMSLNNLGSRLSELGRREEALEAAREAVEHYRRLAKVRPDAFLPDLAGSLNNLGNRLSELGRQEEALEAAREAVEHCRRLAEVRPDAFLPDLASSLNNLGNSLGDLGRREEALDAAREAVEIRRRLAEVCPDAFLPDLAMSLNSLGKSLSELGRREEALNATREAVRIFAELAGKLPGTHGQRLSIAVRNLVVQLTECGVKAEEDDDLRAAMEVLRSIGMGAGEGL